MYIVLNATDPPAPAGAQNVHFRIDSTHLGTSTDPTPVSAYVPLSSISMGFIISNGSAGICVGPLLVAPRAGSMSKCVISVTACDSATALTFRIKQNGTDIFTADPVVATSVAVPDVLTITAFTSTPLAIAAGDQFTIDILSGSPNWKFTAQLS